MRIDALTPGNMDAAQRAIYEEAVDGRRGKAPLPLRAWIHSPALAGHAQRLGEAIRFEVSLPPRVVALAALLIGGQWRCAHIWSAQEAKLRAAGMPAATLARLAESKAPILDDPMDLAAYTTVRTLIEKQALDDATYAMAVATFGQRGVVELIAACGYYTMVAMTLTAFGIDSDSDNDSGNTGAG